MKKKPNNDLFLTKSGKLKKIVFAHQDKITDDAYLLIKELFNIEGALLTNESSLYDFVDFEISKLSQDNIKEKFIGLIADKFGVVIPEILSGESRIWKVVELINEKQKRLIFPHDQRARKRVVS